jgi:hypothetical protein
MNRLRPSLAIVLLLPVAAMAAGDQTIDEYQLKAAFLYNFTKFVEWPPEVFNSPQDALGVCILGKSSIAKALEQAVSGKLAEERKLVIRQVSDLREVVSCQILFVSSSSRMRWRSILGDPKSIGILTVGETDGFISEGGVINLKNEDGKVRIQINVAAADRQKLRISSRLLSLAQLVKTQTAKR